MNISGNRHIGLTGNTTLPPWLSPWRQLGDQDIGVCHAEYMEGLRSSQAKVRLLSLPQLDDISGAAGERNRRFKRYLDSQTAFRGGAVSTVKEAKKHVYEGLTDAVVSLTQRSVQSAASTRFDTGAALEWVAWHNHQRLFGSIGYIPPAQAEEIYQRNHSDAASMNALL